jgi:phage terminase Nu1 subunit (DNA packaging protein)
MTTETQSAFARRIGRAKSWITQLKTDGRLVMDAESGLVEVEASIKRIEATENPARAGVSDRHAESRRRAHAAALAGAVAGVASGRDDPDPGKDYKHWQAVKMRADAEMAQMDRDKKAADLVPREAAEFAIDDLGSAVRASLENVPDRWAPVLAPMTDLQEVRAALVEMVQAELGSMSQRAARRSQELRNAANEPAKA